MSRYPNPGETNPFRSFMDRTHIFNRTNIANVTDIDNRNGILTVTLNGLPHAEDNKCSVPPLWLSTPSSGAAAWGRYMPMKNDVLKVVSGADDKPYVVGYEPGFAHGSKDVEDGLTGWPSLNSIYNTASVDPSGRFKLANKSEMPVAKFMQFVPLNPGEYDFMSTGGAYIHGSDTGRLYMCGGAASVTLNKADMSIQSSSQIISHTADISEFRFGQVRRQFGIDPIEYPLKSDTTGSNREFRVILKNVMPPGAAVDCVSLEIGNVATAQGIIDLSFYGTPVKYSYRAHNSTGVQVHRTSVDDMGNWRMESTAPGSTAEVSYPAITLRGPSATLPVYPTLLSTPYRSAEDTVLSSLAAQIDFLSAQLNTLSLAVSSTCTALSATGTAPVIGSSFLALSTASTAVSGLVSPTLANGTTAVTTFTSGAQSYLSTVVKNG